MKKSILLILTIVCLVPLPLFAEIVDEVQSGAMSADEIPDRPMRDDANLKAVQTAFDKSDPRANVKRHNYSAAVTIKIRCREFMGSTVVLPPGEEISGYVLGDDTNFSFVPLGRQDEILGNKFQVNGKFHGADTNLTVFGLSGNIYSFYLRNDSVKSAFMPSLVTYIDDDSVSRKVAEIKAKEEEQGRAKKAQSKNGEEKGEYLAKLPTLNDPANLDFNYKLKGGDKSIKPIRVFDDGYFTYFQFGENDMSKVRKLPAIYRVVDGFDTPVNTRIQKGMIVAETINDKWTLRSGSAYLCVWRELESNESNWKERGGHER